MFIEKQSHIWKKKLKCERKDEVANKGVFQNN